MKRIPNEYFFAWAEEELTRNGEIRLRVKGNSMYPLLRDQQDEVSLRSCKAEFLRKGDIALFRYRGQHILHRFAGQQDENLLMRGDNVCGRIERCCADDVIGVVVNVYRRKNRDGVRAYKAISPRSLKWSAIIFLWRVKCRLRFFLPPPVNCRNLNL